LAACTPLILLARAIDLGYHDMILLTVALFGFAGLASLRLVIVGMTSEGGTGCASSIVATCLVFVLVGGQLSWALRPYLVRPRAPEPVFVREVEGSLVDAITETLQSARGIYTRDAAPIDGRSDREDVR
ncbi:MAG TPA: hypothetical protein VFQ53_24480, partial [Kofleriaceae bacterium]|nr:hypothetical protein [Kofleriaceae bacterium]